MTPFVVSVLLAAFVAGCASAPKTESPTAGPARFNPAYQPERVFLGSPDAPVLVVKYIDFTSPFCKHDASAIEELAAAHPQKIKVILKQVPLVQLHRQSFVAAQIFEALRSENPKLAHRFYKLAFERQESLKDEAAYWKLLKVERFPIDTIKARIANDFQVNYRILNDYAEFVGFNMEGVPAYVIDGHLVPAAQSVESLAKYLPPPVLSP